MYYMQNSVDSTDNSCQHKAGITKLLQLFRISDTTINQAQGIAERQQKVVNKIALDNKVQTKQNVSH